jgi:zinc transport system permease protein
MTSFWYVLWHNPFLQTALFAGLAASFAGGVVGSYVVVKRIVFISGSISHAVLGGIGASLFLGYLLGRSLPLLVGAILASIFFGFLIGWIHRRYRQREDSVIAAIWSLGMAAGVIFISIVPGNNAALMDFLFGNLLWANQSDVWMLLSLDLIVLAIALLCHVRFLSISFDETQCLLQRERVSFLYFLLLTLVSFTVVLMIQIIGAILVIAMLCLPAAIANLLTQRLSKMICLAVALSLFFTFSGIYLSYTLNWPPGATISLLTTTAYFISLPLKSRYV